METADPRVHRFAWISIAAALITIVLKFTAWWITDSVGLLSDALESFVNLVGAIAALPASFAGWIVVEVDVPEAPTNLESTRISAAWIEEHLGADAFTANQGALSASGSNPR